MFYLEATKATLMAGKMAKGTQQSREEITELFYGINPTTFEIESVSKTRGGMLTRSAKDGLIISHPMTRGGDTQNEIALVFGLMDVFSVPAKLWNSERRVRQVEELRAKAAKLRKTAKAKNGRSRSV
jgi:hypothetical protein